MIGKLDPEERVMGESVSAKRKAIAVCNQGVVEQLYEVISKLGWDCYDDIDVEIGGTSVSGIDVGEEYNKKWQSPLGTRKYNKDAFIIIKNQSRRDLSKSEPFGEGEFNPHHSLNTSEEVESNDDVSGVHAGVVPESNPSEG